MRFLIQRVTHASVSVEGQAIGQIGKGLLIFFGAGMGDTEELAIRFAGKISKMRIFEDGAGKTNLALKDVGGSVLVISQFTLYADCRKGNRPSFLDAAPPDLANALYGHFIVEMGRLGIHTETGSFGASMDVALSNDGPFTIYLDSYEL